MEDLKTPEELNYVHFVSLVESCIIREVITTIITTLTIIFPNLNPEDKELVEIQHGPSSD